MIVPRYYEDLSILHENTMPNRSYYIPASFQMADPVENREASDRFQLLSGNWKFRYFDSIHDLRDSFFALGYDASGFDTIPVPGIWQMHGYDRHKYINSRYPIPADPPYVPQDNPCGAYIHTFCYAKDSSAPKAYLNFEGVDSCFYVWLNGRYVGYSQVSHSTSEFDVTEHLTEGENTLAVLVLKWCDGTYLECQDKFRWTGIFRDVYLLKRPDKMLFDYFVHADTTSVKVQLKTVPEDLSVKLSLYAPDGSLVGTCVSKETEELGSFSQEAFFGVSNPILWNAEQPALYKLVLETEGETVVEEVGLRTIEARDSVVYFNGKPIKFYGVNRHESDPRTGYVIPLEQMKQELQLLKAHNFNGIRTSHYPSSPVFYQLCDRYGFYVIDEADIEAHGAEHLFFEKVSNSVTLWNVMVAENPDFVPSIVDRVQRLVLRDKNRPCAVIWSMGNESAYGCGFEAALAWTKAYDPSRLTHYESARYVNTDRKYDYSNLDLHSEMYESLKGMQEYIDSNPDKPFIQCEYSHAMGNGPGDLEDYYRMFHSDPRFCGGFVWEFTDHAVYMGQAENGKPMYHYGGDFGERHHDGNFCMDGLIYPDRRPHTGMLEFKNVHRPVRACYDQTAGLLRLTSVMDFVDLKEYVDIAWELSQDGVVIRTGRVGELPSVPPRATVSIPLKLDIPAEGKCFVKLLYFRKKASALLEAGHDLGFDQLPLENEAPANREALKLIPEAKGSLHYSEDDTWLTVYGEHFTYTYDKRTAMWHSLVCNGTKLLSKPMELNVWRAPTDNDRNVKLEWFRARYNLAQSRAYETTCLEEGGVLTIRSTLSMGGMTIQPFMRGEAIWTVEPSGMLRLELNVHRAPLFPMLPRLGIRMFLPKEMEQVTYAGRGPAESYSDKRHASWYGRFEAKVLELHEDYLRPQENGSHCDCDFVTVSGGGMSVSAVGEGFSFNASPYTQEELTGKTHSYLLEESGFTVLCLDYAQNGIGSNSCGPVLDQKYALNEPSYSFCINIIPG